MSTLVSVVISAYNAEDFLPQAIESVLGQSMPDFELILADDGSTDNTLQIAKRFQAKDPRIAIDSHENLGMGQSVNRAVKLAKSNIIARMDADDMMNPDRLETQYKFFQEHPEIAMASCFTQFVGENGKVLGMQSFEQNMDLLTLEDTKRYVESNQCIHFAHTGVMFRKEIFEELQGYDGRFWPSDDIELFNRFADAGHGVVIIPKILMKYRLNGSSVITSKFIDSIYKLRWVEDIIRRRRIGENEITYEAFKESLSKQNLIKRIRRKSVIYSNFFFRTAGHHFGMGRYFSFLYYIFLSIISNPFKASNKLLKNLLI